MRLDIARIEAARRRIGAEFLSTPQYVDTYLSEALGCRVVLKVETLNTIRCFKGRGVDAALSALDGIDDDDRRRHVVAASAGNLGQALAYCGRRRGLAVTVTASAAANPIKLARMTSLGADVRLVDGPIEAALAAAEEFARRTRATLIEDSKNLETCAGAGTIGLELAEGAITPDIVLTSLGAGAMATGIGVAIRGRLPGVEVLTVQPERAAGMTMSWRAGHVVDAGPPSTIADGVAGRYVIPEVLGDLLAVADDALLVRETSIIEAMRLLYECAGLVVEPAAALGAASILEDRARFRDATVATVLCGSNVDPVDFDRWVRAGAASSRP
ncbi:MAG: threonine/serine dehydratase [Desertimonas sp.]